MRTKLVGLLCAFTLLTPQAGAAAAAASIDTAALERAWPKETVKTYEVGRHEVRWRQAASKTEGIFAEASFAAPVPQQRAWELATNYTDMGAGTKGVEHVRILEDGPEHQIVEIDLKVLWKRLTLRFEVERETPQVLRCRLRNAAIGEYLALARFDSTSQASTSVTLATWYSPVIHVPVRLVLYAERVLLLQGIRTFLATCTASPTTLP